jgi:phosphoglycerate dehydrogenase-like enzyme
LGLSIRAEKTYADSINIARGRSVVTDDLVAALRSG